MAKVLGRQKKASLEKSTLNRVLVWGRHLMADPSFRWTKSDTNAMGALADEIRRVDHDNYLIKKGQKRGYR